MLGWWIWQRAKIPRGFSSCRDTQEVGRGFTSKLKKLPEESKAVRASCTPTVSPSCCMKWVQAWFHCACTYSLTRQQIKLSPEPALWAPSQPSIHLNLPCVKGGSRCNKIPVVAFHAHSQYQTAGRPPKPVPDPAPGLGVKGTGLWDSPVLTVLRGALSPKHFQPVHVSEHLSFLQCKPTSDTHLASKQATVFTKKSHLWRANMLIFRVSAVDGNTNNRSVDNSCL